MKGIQNTSTNSFGDLIGNGRKYTIPRFQRDYSWEEEQWDDLWQDINGMLSESEDHYMGYLVLQTSNNKAYYVIDGQQRFTTITLIILAAIKAVKELINKGKDVAENEQRVKSLIETYIGHIDPVSLEYDNTLILNRNNDGYYKEYIVKLDALRSRNLSATEKLMKKCFEWYETRLNGKFGTGKEYAEFIVKMVDNLFFTVITVNDEMNAFRVFETLNARGVQLSSADLLKNYFFSLVDKNTGHKGRIEALEEKWIKLSNNVRTDKLPDFLRYYWNSKNKTVRSSDLFKAIRKEIHTDAQVFVLISELMEYSDIYMALKDSNDEYWEHDEEVRTNIGLLQLFNLKQPYSILMAANKNLLAHEFKTILKQIVTICFRYSVIAGKNPNEIERTFNESAVYISKNKTLHTEGLLKVYLEDNEFTNAFAVKDFVINSRNTKVVRYILGAINRFKGDPFIVDINDENNSIEHILPQHPNEDWNMDESKSGRLYIRLGNLCLLERSLNNRVGNQNYEIKKKVYESSRFITTKSIPNHYSLWDETAINSRQKRMADIAKSIWKIDTGTAASAAP